MYQFREIRHRAIAFEDAFCDDESTGQRSPSLPVLLVDSFQDFLKALHVVVVEPADGATRDLEALLNRKVDAPVSDDDISTLAEGGNNGGDCRERLRVEDGVFGSKEICDVLLQVGVHIDRPVETRWAATSETVFPQSFSRLLFYVFVASETGEVEAGEVHYSLSGTNELGLGTSWTRDDRNRGKVQGLSFCKRLFERFWNPFINELVDFLVETYQLAG